jgi:hypothetical protein
MTSTAFTESLGFAAFEAARQAAGDDKDLQQLTYLFWSVIRPKMH